MTPKNFKHIMTSVFGKERGWQVKAAEYLGVVYPHVNKMANGKAKITERTAQQALELWKKHNPLKEPKL